MILVTVMYPAGPEGSFDRAYYLGTHIPLVKERWSGLGLERVELVRGTASGDGGPPAYQVIALLTFASAEAFRAAAETHGAEIFGDIPKFTSIQPLVQVSEPLS